MPIAKHRTKKTPHSVWVKRRNKRKYQRKYHAKHISSNKQVDMAALSEPIKETPLTPQKDKPKGFIQKGLEGIKNVFVDQKENSKSAV
tara:strand:+ start:1133 stop:1396 length:264 start_codon:yes stop_codon:yes gene_type:complete